MTTPASPEKTRPSLRPRPLTARLCFAAQARAAALAIGASTLLSAHSAQAATATWVGANSGLWSDTAGNWTGGAGTGGRPATGDSLLFGTASITTLTDDLMTPASFTLAGITFNGASAYTINPNVSGTNGFTLSGGLTDTTGLTQTINDLITLSNVVHTVTLTAAGDQVVLGGNISVAGTSSNLTTSGLGTLVLSGNDNFGTGGTVSVGAGTTLQLRANANNTSSSVSSALNTASGKFTISGGTLQLRSDSAVTFNGGNAASFGSAVTNTIDVNAASSTFTAGTISFATAGLTIGGGNTSTSIINVTGGNGYSLSLGTITDTSGASGSKTFKIVPTTANVAIGGFTSTTNGGGRTLNLDGSSSSNSIGAILLGVGASGTNVSKTNTSMWTLTGNNTYTGTTTINGGTLILSGNNTSATGATTLTSGTLQLNNTSALAGTTSVVLNGGTIDNILGTAITSAASGSIGGNFAFGSSGETSANNLGFTGTTAFSTNLTKTITLNGTGTTLSFASTFQNNTDGNQTLAVNGGGNTLVLGGLLLDNTGTTGRTQTINGTGNVTISGAVANGASTQAQSLTYGGTGTLTLNGNNTYTGTTTVGSGSATAGTASTLVLSGDNTSATGAINVGNGATLQLLTNANAAKGSALTLFNGSTLQLRADADTTFTPASLSVGAAAVLNFDVNSSSSGSGKTLALAGGLAYTGGTDQINVTGGNGYALSLGAITGVGNGVSFTLNPTTANLIVASITPGGNSSTIYFTGSGNTTVTGAITNSPTKANPLVFNQTGVVTLAGTNTDISPTTVNAGTLLVNGSTASGSAVTVLNSGTLLGGTGTVAGTVSVGATGTAGAALTAATRGTSGNVVAANVGTLNTGALTMASGSIFHFDVLNTSGTAGTGYDQVVVNGVANLGNATLEGSILTGLTFTAGQQLELINNTGTGVLSTTFNGIAEGSTVNMDGYAFAASYLGGDGNDFVLTAEAVPEPATVLGGALLAGVAGWRQRRSLRALLARFGRGEAA